MEEQISDNRQLRLFVAVDINDGVRGSIAALIEKMRPMIGTAKWVDVDNLHITLKFLGSISEEEIPKLSRCIKEATTGFPAFNIDIREIGAFSSFKKARVFWVGVDQGSDKFKALHRSIDSALASEGYPSDDRSFHPHLTIARLKEPTELSGAVSDLKSIEFGRVKVKEVVLYSSHLTPQGPEYSVVETFFLGLS